MEATTSIEATSGALRTAPEKGSRVRVPISDERLVKRIRAGSDDAFTVLYERYQGRLLSFCRHMLGSQAEAEDAVQQCFVNAYRDLLRGEKDLNLRPWLYRIARNQCLSMLRARRYEPELGEDQASLRGLSEEVGERAELRELLGDLGRLPADQREALVLAELNDNSHAEVAEILGCDREKVKSLVFQARASLIKSREARAVPCEDVQRQLSVLRGGSLRRTQLRRHLAECPACRAFGEQVKAQRAALAIVLPVAPSASLKLGGAGVLAAAKASAGAAAGTGATVSCAATTGSAATLAAKLGASGSALKGLAAAAAVTAAVGAGAGIEVAQHRQEARHVPAGATAPPRAHASPSSAAAAGDRGADPQARRHAERPNARGERGARHGGREQRGARGFLELPRSSIGRLQDGLSPGRRAGKREPGGHGRPARTKLGRTRHPARPRERKPETAPSPARPERDAAVVPAPDVAEDQPVLPAE